MKLKFKSIKEEMPGLWEATFVMDGISIPLTVRTKVGTSKETATAKAVKEVTSPRNPLYANFKTKGKLVEFSKQKFTLEWHKKDSDSKRQAWEDEFECQLDDLNSDRSMELDAIAEAKDDLDRAKRDIELANKRSAKVVDEIKRLKRLKKSKK